MAHINNKIIDLYHASPDDIRVIHPYYNSHFGCKGIFLSTYHSIVSDWASYIFSKKDKQKKHEVNSYYKYLYIYKISMPKFVYDHSTEFFNRSYKESACGEGEMFSFWYWGYQIFVPEKYQKFLSISGKKKITYPEFLDKYDIVNNSKWELSSWQYFKNENKNG